MRATTLDILTAPNLLTATLEDLLLKAGLSPDTFLLGGRMLSNAILHTGDLALVKRVIAKGASVLATPDSALEVRAMVLVPSDTQGCVDLPHEDEHASVHTRCVCASGLGKVLCRQSRCFS